jgi:hypothetical protein
LKKNYLSNLKFYVDNKSLKELKKLKKRFEET